MTVASKIGAQHYLECSGMTGEGVRDVFQYAARAALLTQLKRDLEPSWTAPSKGMKAIKQLFKPAPKSKPLALQEKGKIAPVAISFAAAKVELEKFLASSTTPKSLKIFRLLIIGKTGCGKTTILSKVISIVCVFRKDVHSITGMRREHGK